MIPTNPGNQPPPSTGKKIAYYLLFGIMCAFCCLFLWRVWKQPYVFSAEKELRDTARAHGWRDSAVRIIPPLAPINLDSIPHDTSLIGWGFQWGHRDDRKTTYSITFDFATVAYAVGLKGKWHVVDTCRWEAFKASVKDYKAKLPSKKYKL